MYTIQKSPCFTDQLLLEDSSGNSLTLDIQLGITPELAQQYRALQVRLLELQADAKDRPGDPQVIEKTGKAVSEVLSLLLGSDNLRKMTEFYAGDYISMLTDAIPYIQEVIVPQFAQLAKERKRQLKRRFK